VGTKRTSSSSIQNYETFWVMDVKELLHVPFEYSNATSYDIYISNSMFHSPYSLFSIHLNFYMYLMIPLTDTDKIWYLTLVLCKYYKTLYTRHFCLSNKVIQRSTKEYQCATMKALFNFLLLFYHLADVYSTYNALYTPTQQQPEAEQNTTF
jgi:hypothetical protein